jgi:hypothetical protein
MVQHLDGCGHQTEDNMKTINSRLKNALLFLLAAAMTLTAAYGQEGVKKKEKEVVTEEMIASKNFVFKAQSALPLGGRSIQLTSDYDLRVSKDTLVSYLPYFGRAFVAPVNPSEGGIRFTSTSFDYRVKERRKGGWEITLLPKDVREVRQLFLNVSKGGYASLQVSSNNRQPITFNGYIEEKAR